MCMGKRFLIAALGIILVLTAIVCRADEQKIPAAHATPAQEDHAALPLEEIAERAAEVSSYLRSLPAQFAPGHEIEKIRKELSGLSDRLAVGLQETMQKLQGRPTLDILEVEEQFWQKNQLRLGKWLHTLVRTADRMEAALTRLTDLQKRWSLTLDAARTAQAPATIIQRISAVLTAIETALNNLQPQRKALLGLQGRIDDETIKCETALAQIAQAQKTAMGGLVTRENRPIWSTGQWVRGRNQDRGRWPEIAAGPWADIAHYLRDPFYGMPFHFGLLIAFSVLFLTMRRHVNRWAPDDASTIITTVTDRPCAAALIVTLLIASSPDSPAPPTVRNLFEVLALAPMIRLIRPAVDQRIIGGLYALGLLFFLDSVRRAYAGAMFFDQAMIVLEALAGMAVIGWSLAFGHLRQSLTQVSGARRLRALRSGAAVVLGILGAGLAAGLLGYMRIARLMVSGILIGGSAALALSASVKVLSGVAAFFLRVRPLSHLQMVRHHRDLMERRTHRVLVWLAIGGWTIRVLDYLGLFGPALSFVKALLALKVERGSISFSVEDVIAFFLVIWAAHLLSGFIRFVLREDIYPRRGVPHGKAFAASRLLHYTILTVGFITGMGVLGVDLTKVTVLLGALGVGIGFGLQNVVNNFVSGLILLFEQPVHVGDFLEVGDLYGQVQRIGLRASIVRTRHGAEIIVPNSQFISNQVTNWTLSDQLRRINLPVGVSYGAAPQKVMEVIESAAGTHPRVLKNPPPRALFVGFGDSSIDFELRVWTDQFVGWSQIRSEVAVAVHDAVQAVGMSFPFPHREILLHYEKEDRIEP